MKKKLIIYEQYTNIYGFYKEMENNDGKFRCG